MQPSPFRRAAGGYGRSAPPSADMANLILRNEGEEDRSSVRNRRTSRVVGCPY